MDYLELDPNLTEEDKEIKKSIHEFAKEVIRPIAKELDEMSPEEAIAPKSPFWDFMKQGYKLGHHTYFLPGGFVEGLGGLTPLQQHIVMEELSWGSVGFAVALGVAQFPAFYGALFPDDEILEKIVLPYYQCTDASIRGCWAITEPDHGSDLLMPGHPVMKDPKIKWQCQARLDGDSYVIKGQKSSWVSCGTVATHAALFCQLDPKMGISGGGIAIVPLDLPGVSKGKPLNKLGQRDLNQGEIFFDEVRIPRNYMLVPAEAYENLLWVTLSKTLAAMSAFLTGLGRAAFEETLQYAKGRVQGGQALVEHKNVQMRLFDMFTKLEASRLLSRAAIQYNYSTFEPATEYSAAAKVFVTEAAFQITHEAVQIFGGNGVSKEYLIEKLFRDARAAMIEDGSNDILAIAGGYSVIQNYPRK